eukprot:TRINITY_DN39643_c0_g1_i1.p1 TRINITY_DN39643_c0_g1~~TRINITY_DN39643_c0_g1_i1.p1  ORF type:complete len:121 (-),score=22.56 TRINITY_DN39643_c0_g1_i1:15-377(-)
MFESYLIQIINFIINKLDQQTSPKYSSLISDQSEWKYKIELTQNQIINAQIVNTMKELFNTHIYTELKLTIDSLTQSNSKQSLNKLKIICSKLSELVEMFPIAIKLSLNDIMLTNKKTIV